MNGTMTAARPRLTMRQGAGLLLHACAIAALVPALIWLAPASHWNRPLILVVLGVLALIAAHHEVPLPSGIRFEATVSLSLIAIAVAGPLPALAIMYATILADGLRRDERLLRAGNLANVASYGWYVLAGAWVLALMPDSGPAAALAALTAAGMLQLLVNWAVGPAIYATLWLGHPMRAIVQMLRDALPAGLVMALLGGVTVELFGTLDVAALALFALVAVLPQTALTYAARTRPVAALDPHTATRRYATAIAMQLGLPRSERRHVDDVIRVAHERGLSGDPGEHLSHTVVDWSEASCAAGHVTEWWNGAGWPAGLPGTIIPEAARIAAVAQTWAALTAEGSPRLGHVDALAHLDAAAGVRLDPAVVRAARAVVGQERLSAGEPAPEPRLHNLHVPAPLRRVLASG
jgi:HD domain